ncbi:MAG: hypothetical protein QM523_07810 [Candidatus Pacebacteria bacterium]|nr:hypothetical protein [Candidatus Paceibacterota bacterium]
MSNILPFRRPDPSKPMAETHAEGKRLPSLAELFEQPAPRHRLSAAKLTLVVTNQQPRPMGRSLVALDPAVPPKRSYFFAVAAGLLLLVIVGDLSFDQHYVTQIFNNEASLTEELYNFTTGSQSDGVNSLVNLTLVE